MRLRASERRLRRVSFSARRFCTSSVSIAVSLISEIAPSTMMTMRPSGSSNSPSGVAFIPTSRSSSLASVVKSTLPSASLCSKLLSSAGFSSILTILPPSITTVRPSAIVNVPSGDAVIPTSRASDSPTVVKRPAPSASTNSKFVAAAPPRTL